jgi:primosomal protein N' (replication factor Y) (superfamily II helicase)
VVKKVHGERPKEHLPKTILSVLDESPVVNALQFTFWEWIAFYYLCYEGEVMNAALPSAFKLASESGIILNPLSGKDYTTLNEKEHLLVESLHNQDKVKISEVAKIIGQHKVIPLINTLIEKGFILIEEDLPERYKPKKETFVRLTGEYLDNENKLRDAFDSLEKRARKQLELLMAYIHLSRYGSGNVLEVSKASLLKHANVSQAVLDGLLEKGIFETYDKLVSRLEEAKSIESSDTIALSPAQAEAYARIGDAFKEKDVVLLHGVTSSGKTEMYIKFIQETLDKGKQVLYLLPEIALTTQIISRLQHYFGDRVGVYHSRFNENERVEIWNKVSIPAGNGKTQRYDIVLGARSAVFLPYSDLGLVIVDEEHDSSYKQYEPAPRYNGRDTALYLAHLHGAKTILGSATPSVESYYNATEGKYGLVEINERYGNMELPEILVVDLKNELRMKRTKSHFSAELIARLEEAMKNHEQAILFQNRRGFSLRLECDTCNWMPTCKNCDVTLVYHKQNNQLRCHYCGYVTRVPEHCPECKGTKIRMRGFGTEQVEEELSLVFPLTKIARMDLDTTRTRHSHQKILNDFGQKKIDILVGTQMVTKGLDFENVSTVGILNAGNMLSFPDFRAAERSFQLMAQVSGRSGRKNKRGKVIIQTYDPGHPIIANVISHDYISMFRQQLVERRKFKYPPYYRLIRITVKHRDARQLNKVADLLASRMKTLFPGHVLGPEYPLVSRIMNYYLKQILIKIERQSPLHLVKEKMMQDLDMFSRIRDWGAFRLVIDVDPQ